MSLVSGLGGGLYTIVDKPLAEVVSNISPQIAALIPQDPMDFWSAMIMVSTSTFLALSAYDMIVPKFVKKMIKV